MDLTAALRWVNAAVANRLGYALREPEIVILTGTWRGLTYEQMAASSEYSTNYLMRDVAPKLWKQLSNIFGHSVGKTNFRVALESYIANHPPEEQEIEVSGFEEKDTAASLVSKSGQAGWLVPGSQQSAPWHELRTPLLTADSFNTAPLYGRQLVLNQLCTWLQEAKNTHDYSRIIGIWGLKGIGKSRLLESALSQAAEEFEGIVWRSLHSRPRLGDLCQDILLSLGVVDVGYQSISYLTSLLANRSFVVVLEGFDAILAPGQLAGSYRAGYEDYAEFIQAISGSQSCLILSGIEGPTKLIQQSRDASNASVRILFLAGLSQEASSELLSEEGLSDRACWPDLIHRYQGHPLALKSAARVIQDIFDGQVNAFLSQSPVLFTDIMRILNPSFERLSENELDVLHWLASQDTSPSLEDLTKMLGLSSTQLVSTLDSLRQRSLLLVSTNGQIPTFSLDGLVQAFGLQQLEARLICSTDKDKSMATYGAANKVTSDIIDLSPDGDSVTQLGTWVTGKFGADWHALDRLFETDRHRLGQQLRSIYHLRDDAFTKRCKSIWLENKRGSSSDRAADTGLLELETNEGQGGREQVIVLVAVSHNEEEVYQVCVQIQSRRGEISLPQNLTLKLINDQERVLATVIAEASDTFVQLPYFRGTKGERFFIEVALSDSLYTEQFIL